MIGDTEVAKILCIDTDKHFGKFVCAHLLDAGHKCVLDSRGDRVLKMVGQHNVDLVIAEVMLADVCGFEVCRRIRAHAEFFSLPVILMSSMASENEVKHGLSQGADDYLPKPVESKTIVTRVEEHLRIAQQAEQPDPITGLSSANKMKAIIQRNIIQGIPFAVAYIEMDNIAAFGKFAGNEHRNKALRHISRILDRYGKSLESSRFHAAHMGLGHFVCVMEAEHIIPYCDRISQSWERHLPEFYSLVGLKMPKGAIAKVTNFRSVPLLSLIICATDSELAGTDSVQGCFDVLAHLIAKAATQKNTGLYLDNRKTKKRKQGPV